MKNLIRIASALIALAISSPVLAQSPDGAAPAPASNGLNPGDQIRISVWRKPEYSGDFSIA
ncbi:MAG TPA: hypothetical protein VM053_00845, partial [Gemmatimonadaceae bacterium]|nr:hypothetical protein [Gemmatimonadaceae bacterium]